MTPAAVLLAEQVLSEVLLAPATRDLIAEVIATGTTSRERLVQIIQENVTRGVRELLAAELSSS